MADEWRRNALAAKGSHAWGAAAAIGIWTCLAAQLVATTLLAAPTRAQTEDLGESVHPPVIEAASPDLASAWIYWRSEEVIGRVRIDGSGRELLASGEIMVAGPTIDHQGGKLYWSERLGERQMARIRRSDLDGSNAEIVDPEVGYMGDLCVQGGKLLWSLSGLARIQRADLDGSNPDDLFLDQDAGFPTLLAATDDAVFWVDSAANAIRRFDLEGRRIVDVLPPMKSFIDKLIRQEVSGAPHGLATDGERLFWTEPPGGRIFSAGLDGSDPREFFAGDSMPFDIEVHRGKLYWSDIGNREIRRANLDGSGIEVMLADDSQYPHWIEVTDDWIYVSDSITRAIRRVAHDGPRVEDLVTGDGAITGPSFDVEEERTRTSASPVLQGVEVSSGKLYWAESWSGRILRSDLDGDHVESVVSGLELPRDLLVEGGWLYWSESEKIRRTRPGGDQIEDVIAADGVGLAIIGKILYFAEGLQEGVFSTHLGKKAMRMPEEIISRPLVRAALAEAQEHPETLRILRGLAIGGNKVYWTELGQGVIRAADLDGANVADVVTGAQLASVVAVRDGTVCWAAFEKIMCAELDHPEVHREVLDGFRALALALTDG